MKKEITLGLLGLGAITLGAENNTDRVDYSIKPKLKGGKCSADLKGIKESEGKRLTGFKCNLSEKDKALFEKAGLSKLKTIVIYNKDTQEEILDTIAKMKKEDTRFQFDVNYIIKQGLAKEGQTKETIKKPASNPVKPKEVSVKPAPKETKLRPRITDKILNKKQGTDKDFVLDIGAFDSKLKCFIPTKNIREILNNDGKYIYVDCHRKMGREMLKGFSHRIEIKDASLRKEIVDFIRDYHNEHTDRDARYIDYMDIPTDKEIRDADYDEIPILVVPYPASYRDSLKNYDETGDENEIAKVLQKYQKQYASK